LRCPGQTHLLAIALALLHGGTGCPLTTLEMALHARAGAAVQDGGLIRYWRTALHDDCEARFEEFALARTLFGLGEVGASGFFGRVRGLAADAQHAVDSAAAGALLAINKIAACARCYWATAIFFSKLQTRQGRSRDARLQHGPGSCRPPLHAAVKRRAGQQRQREGGQQAQRIGQQLRRPEMADQRIDQQAH
jgi:hypothetical protein